MIRRILVVDNNPLLLDMLARFLGDEGYDVRCATDGLAALAVLDDIVPDVIIVDQVMPNISGDKLCRVIRATPALREVRLVVLSALVVEEEVDFLAFGADACIAKGPFAQLRENIRSLLAMFGTRPDWVSRQVIGREQLFQREITRELLDIHQHFAVILQSMKDGVVQLSRERRIVFVNRAATEIIGRPEEKLLSSDFLTYLRADARPLVAAALARSALPPASTDPGDPGQALGAQQEIFLGQRQVLLTLVPSADPANAAPWVVMHDVTEQKQAERVQLRYQQELEAEVGRQTAELAAGYRKLQAEFERRKKVEVALQASHTELERRVAIRSAEVEKLYRQLLHSEKLSAVGKLAASIAHEFNNPICGIRNVLGGLQRRLALAGPDRELVEMAIRECDRVARLTGDLQSFNRPTSAQLDLLDLHAALADILLLCKKKFQNEGVKVQLELAPDLPRIMMVADQLKQVMLNLLTNAGEAIGSEGGLISIATRRVGTEVAISFTDTGAGISAENLSHIFEPFFSTKSAVKATGLGLAVSYGIIKRHGGRIEVESDEGQGACFTVFLPVPPDN